ncbi:MAG: acyl--CoA ligase [Planctomycetes bacterium]|nr:acyl--CoA ligase [Planctomycetota bacterium]
MTSTAARLPWPAHGVCSGMPARVTDALFAHARARPDALAVVDGETRLDWRSLASLVESAARSLRSGGLLDGDRVALRANDGAAALVALLAVLHAGGVHVPVDHTLAEPEVRALIATLRTRWSIDLDRSAVPGVIGFVATGLPGIADPLGSGASAFMRQSSGTTGVAKGVLLSHATILERIVAANQVLRLGPDDRVMWLLPMAYHLAVSILLYIHHGTAIIFANHMRASVTARIARAESVTFGYASPYHVRQLARLPPGEDLPASLTRMVSTTTALDATAAADFRARHGIPVCQALGIIEVGLPFVSPGDAGEVPGELGSPVSGYQVAIRDADGMDCLPGACGELSIAGPGLFDAYVEPWRPRSEVLDRGFFRTGDLAARDDQGRVRLLGRCKDLINVGGVKVFPLEVETVLDAHPDVVASRVQSRLDPRTGEQVHADVELAAGVDHALARSALERWCAERLAPLKRPAGFTFGTALARTPSGKVKRDG